MNVEKDDATGMYIIDDDGDRMIKFIPWGTVNGKTYTYKLSVHAQGGGDIEGIRFAREAISWMFNETDCVKMFGLIAESNKQSLVIANVCQWDTLDTYIDPETKEKFIVKGVTIGQWLSRRGKEGHEKALAKKEVK